MSTRVLMLCALSLVTLPLTACQAPAPAGLSDADKTALRQNDETFASSANAKNFAAAAALYMDDASLLLPNAPAVQGRQQIQKWMSDNPPLSDFKIEPVDIDGRGDLAYVRGNYALTMTPPSGAAVHDRGKFIEIWRRQPDGSWKIRWDIFNSDLAAGQ
jgi:ketosteroid isomerase-like protein